MPPKGESAVEEDPPSLAELQSELVQVQATPEECRRLDVNEFGILMRVVASPTGRRDSSNL